MEGLVNDLCSEDGLARVSVLPSSNLLSLLFWRMDFVPFPFPLLFLISLMENQFLFSGLLQEFMQMLRRDISQRVQDETGSAEKS